VLPSTRKRNWRVAAATPEEPTARGSWCLPGAALRAARWPWLLASCRSSYACGAPPLTPLEPSHCTNLRNAQCLHRHCHSRRSALPHTTPSGHLLQIVVHSRPKTQAERAGKWHLGAEASDVPRNRNALLHREAVRLSQAAGVLKVLKPSVKLFKTFNTEVCPKHCVSLLAQGACVRIIRSSCRHGCVRWFSNRL
jgi:hypothetical protein